MKAADICATAADLVSGERDRQHGDAKINHENIAALWNAYLGYRLRAPLTAKDAAIIMALLKIARTKTGDHNDDDYVDAVGYLALAGQMAEPEPVEILNLYPEGEAGKHWTPGYMREPTDPGPLGMAPLIREGEPSPSIDDRFPDCKLNPDGVAPKQFKHGDGTWDWATEALSASPPEKPVAPRATSGKVSS